MIRSTDFVLTEAQSAAGIDGRLKISLKVNERGLVENADIIAGPIYPCKNKPKVLLEEFMSSAKKNARTFLFEPPSKNGKPKSSTIVLTVTVGEAYKNAVKMSDVEENTKPLSLKDYLDAGIVNRRAVKLVQPLWPITDLRFGFIGEDVDVDVMIDQEGIIIAAGTISGRVEFQTVARNAACESKFTPIIVAGKPSRVIGRIRYHFGR